MVRVVVLVLINYPARLVKKGLLVSKVFFVEFVPIWSGDRPEANLVYFSKLRSRAFAYR